MDQLAEHHGGGAPDTLTVQLEVGNGDRHLGSPAPAEPPPGRVLQLIERDLEDLRHFGDRWYQAWTRIGDRDHRVERKVTDWDIERGTTAKPLPASPARAASIFALSASRLVCLLMLSISLMQPSTSLTLTMTSSNA